MLSVPWMATTSLAGKKNGRVTSEGYVREEDWKCNDDESRQDVETETMFDRRAEEDISNRGRLR
jgi:hypothetical protein